MPQELAQQALRASQPRALELGQQGGPEQPQASAAAAVQELRPELRHLAGYAELFLQPLP